MPYKSRAQAAFFNANRKKLEAEGVNVDEWNQASKGKKLPKRTKTAAINHAVKAAITAALNCTRHNPRSSASK